MEHRATRSPTPKPNPNPDPHPHPEQGDVKSGRIARADVAAIAVESLASGASFDTTFECYDGDTAKVPSPSPSPVPSPVSDPDPDPEPNPNPDLLTRTAQELNSVMASNAKGVATGTREATSVMSGKESRADSWPKLFEGLERDRA